MMFRTLTLCVALALAACASAPIAETPSQTTASIDPIVFLPPPPPAESAFELSERAVVRGPWSAERRQQALEDNATDPWAAFDSILGPGFNAEALPATAAVLDRAGRFAGLAGEPAKALHRRPRPFLSDSAISICIEDTPRLRESFSYPSGHGALGFSWALVLAELLPAHADAIVERGRDYGWSRVVCGVHYPSDIDASRTVAAAAVARLHADPEFQRLMANARTELARAFPSAN